MTRFWIKLNQNNKNNEEAFEPQKCEEEPKFHAKWDPNAKITADLGSEAFLLKDMKTKNK